MSRILVIEDDFQLLRLCTRLLQNEGHIVYPAATFPAALDMFRLYLSFSLCLSDITVGVYDQMTLIRELHGLRIRYKTPMLVMSAHMERYGSLCDQLKLPYISKPFFNAPLMQRVRDVMTPDATAANDEESVS
jgi:CheY-like chemotaxis protein